MVFPFSDVEEVYMVLGVRKLALLVRHCNVGIAYVDHLELLILCNLDGLTWSYLQSVKFSTVIFC